MAKKKKKNYIKTPGLLVDVENWSEGPWKVDLTSWFYFGSRLNHYDFDVDWGDGSPMEHYTWVPDGPEVNPCKHTYESEGQYCIAILGHIPCISSEVVMGASADEYKEHVEFLRNSFRKYVTSVSVNYESPIRDFHQPFRCFEALVHVDERIFEKCGNVSDCSHLFDGCKSMMEYHPNLLKPLKNALIFRDSFRDNTMLGSVPKGFFWHNERARSFMGAFMGCVNLRHIGGDGDIMPKVEGREHYLMENMFLNTGVYRLNLIKMLERADVERTEIQWIAGLTKAFVLAPEEIHRDDTKVFIGDASMEEGGKVVYLTKEERDMLPSFHAAVNWMMSFFASDGITDSYFELDTFTFDRGDRKDNVFTFNDLRIALMYHRLGVTSGHYPFLTSFEECFKDKKELQWAVEHQFFSKRV